LQPGFSRKPTSLLAPIVSGPLSRVAARGPRRARRLETCTGVSCRCLPGSQQPCGFGRSDRRVGGLLAASVGLRWTTLGGRRGGHLSGTFGANEPLECPIGGT